MPEPARSAPAAAAPAGKPVALPQPAAAPTAAPLEERPAAIREPAAPPRPPRRTSERTAAAGATAQRAAGGAAAAASTAGARAAAWSRSAAVRARDGVVAAYRSPRTRNARTTVAAYARRTAAFASYQTRRGSAYVREQYDIDPRRTLIVAGVAAAVLLLLLVVVVSAIGGGGGGDGTAGTTDSGVQAPALGTPLATGDAAGNGASPAASPTPATATAQPLPGTPYDEAAILAALRSRGLTANATDEAFACDSPGTTPKSYRVSANGAEQRIVLLVYPDAAAFSRDWAVGAGRPQYQNGNCAADAAVVYFNVNVMLVFPQTANAGVQSQISDAFLALP
ncbi:MAG: hypothetical protein R3B59_10010 [Dehalococcoidia bacterium]